MHGSAGEHDGADTFEVQKTCEVGLPGGSDGKVSAYNAGDLVQSLGWDDPLEKEMATPSSSLVWKIPWDRGA